MRSVITSVVAGTVLLAACGGGDRPADAPAGGAQSAPAAAAGTAATPVPSAEAQARAGSAVFRRTCATCHQQNGAGIPGTFPPLEHSPIVAGNEGRLIRLVLHGLQGPITVEGNTFNGVMPPWKSISDGDMALVLTYVRATFGGGAPAITPEAVARERAATASRTTMWTARELGL